MQIPIKAVKQDIFINFILDESGSMKGQRTAVINGFNEYLQDHKRKTDVNYFITLTKFSSSDQIKVVYSARAISEVSEITPEDYAPDGGTALYDAIARTVTVTESRMREMNGSPKILTFIFTDGEENASREYSVGSGGAARLNTIITAKEDSGDWTFTFIGATRDSLKQAQNIGIKSGNSIQYDPQNFYGTARAMSFATDTYTNNVSCRGIARTDTFFRDAGINGLDDLTKAADAINLDKVGVVAPNTHTVTVPGVNSTTPWTLTTEGVDVIGIPTKAASGAFTTEGILPKP